MATSERFTYSSIPVAIYLSCSYFRQSLKTFLFGQWDQSAV